MRLLRLRRFGLRGRLLLSVVAAIAVVLAALVLAFNVVLGNRLNGEATGVLRARASAEVAAAVLLVVALAAAWLIDRALRPVANMTRQAADWSEHDLDRRFALGPAHDELTRLASTLDGLLERLSASLRHEQRLSAE